MTQQMPLQAGACERGSCKALVRLWRAGNQTFVRFGEVVELGEVMEGWEEQNQGTGRSCSRAGGPEPENRVKFRRGLECHSPELWMIREIRDSGIR